MAITFSTSCAANIVGSGHYLQDLGGGQLWEGGEKFWTGPEKGEAKNLGRVAKGRVRKISDLFYFFQITEIQCLLEFLWVLVYFQILGQRGAKNFGEGGGEKFKTCPGFGRRGRKILDR